MQFFGLVYLGPPVYLNSRDILGRPLIKFKANFLAARLFRTPGYSGLQSKQLSFKLGRANGKLSKLKKL